MSASYFIYAEAKINDKWVLINGKIPEYKWDWDKEEYTDEFKYKVAYTYYNGSRSYFGDACDKLKDIGRCGKFKELSDALKEDWANAVKDESEKKQTYYTPFLIDYAKFKEYAHPKHFTHHGLIHKDMIFAFENDDIEELWQNNEVDFANMSDEERQLYVYYEWDEPYDWAYHFKQILKNLDCQVEQFLDMNYYREDIPIRLVFIAE